MMLFYLSNKQNNGENKKHRSSAIGNYFQFISGAGDENPEILPSPTLAILFG
jgi:hypothetical protein